jgi:hypothetical protein
MALTTLRLPRYAFSNGKAVTPNDVTNLPDGPCHALSITTGGAYSVIFAADATDTPVTVTLAAGINDVAVKRVRSTGSASVSGIVALYG